MKSLQYINSIIASKKDMGLLVFRILIGIAFLWHGVTGKIPASRSSTAWRRIHRFVAGVQQMTHVLISVRVSYAR